MLGHQCNYINMFYTLKYALNIYIYPPVGGGNLVTFNNNKTWFSRSKFHRLEGVMSDNVVKRCEDL